MRTTLSAILGVAFVAFGMILFAGLLAILSAVGVWTFQAGALWALALTASVAVTVLALVCTPGGARWWRG